MTTKINTLVSSLLNKNNSILFDLLSHFEKDFLEKLFDKQKKIKFSLFDDEEEFNPDIDDLELKLFILNNLGSQVLEKEETRKKYFSDDKLDIFFKLIYELNKNCFEKCEFINNEDIYEKKIESAFYSTVYAILSDKTVDVNTLLKDLKFTDISRGLKNDFELLESYIIYIFIKISIRIQNYQDKENINHLIKEADKLIQNIIDSIQSNEEYISSGLKLSSYANVLYVLKEYFYFMFTGKCTDGNNFESIVDSALFNAHRSIANNQKFENKIILIRYAIKSLYEKSFWHIAETSPLIKKFFEKTITDNNYILSLMPSQSNTIHDLLSAKQAYVVNMPTSAGKTLLAELYLLYNFHIHRNNDNKYPLACYIVPTNALINQVKYKLEKELSGLDINIESVLPYYDIDEIENEILEQEKINILISTPEKLDFLVRSDNELLKDLKIVILDEAHNLSDETRGSKFELLLATMKQKYKGLQYLLLTPFIKKDSAHQISEWLAESKQASTVITSEWSPSKQYLGYATFNDNNSNIIYLPSARNNIIEEELEIKIENRILEVKNFLGDSRTDRKHRTIVLLEKYLLIGNTTLVLCESVSSTKKTAEAVVEYFTKNNQLQDISNEESIQELIQFINDEDAGNEELQECLKYGVAFHNAKMSQHLKEKIELLVSEGFIKVLCATTTLAQGMNFPITNVIFQFHVRMERGKNKKTKEERTIPSSDFMNIAGRAGRAYYDSEGHIILSQSSNSEKPEDLKIALKKYIEDDKKEIVSSLTKFFETLDSDAEIGLQMLNSEQSVTNFLQYINHIIRVVYDNNFDKASNELAQILNTSLIYKQLGKKAGFIESQLKIRNFSKKYIGKIKEKSLGDLTLADLSGISDISLGLLRGKIKDYKEELKLESKNTDEYMDIHNIIINDKKYKKLSRIVEIIASIPEMKLELGHTSGRFNPDSVAIMIIEWVNGSTINNISSTLQTELWSNKDINSIVNECNHYVNGTMKNFIPWGVKIYQALTEKEENKHENLPSYIYYGVKDNASVILSKLNIPRFKIDYYKQKIFNDLGEDSIKVSNMKNLKKYISNLNS